MSNIVFTAKNRNDFGSAKVNRLRRSGRIPGVIYGHGQTIPIDLDAKEFSMNIRKISESTIVKVDVEGNAHDAFVKETQRTIRDGKILHVDFYEIEMGKILRTHVSVHTFGNPVGVRDGGILETPLHEIEVECLPKDLPEQIKVDISNLAVNQSIHVRDLELGDGVKLISAEDQVIALVKFAKAEAVPAAAEAAADAAAPEAAAGDKAADAKAADSKAAEKK
ncbi:50S ribosomal protein L25 [Spirochaetia bacterium]|nr:50S ribosomal protein L25 [Spirochaetia bacterium]